MKSRWHRLSKAGLARSSVAKAPCWGVSFDRGVRLGRHGAGAALLVAGFALTPFADSMAQVQTQWISPGIGDWGVPGNWLGNAVPTTQDDALVTTSTARISGQAFDVGVATAGSNGTVDIRNAGALSVASDLLAEGNATVRIQDAGSRLNVGGFMSIGGTGAGALSLLNGGKASASSGQVQGPGSTVSIDGAGSALTIGLTSFVVQDGASMSVTNGGAATFGSEMVIRTGSVLADGIGSTVTVTPGGQGLAVGLGRGENGVLTVQNGARLSVDQLTLGYDPGSVGTLNIGNGNASPGTLDVRTVITRSGTGHVVFDHSNDVAVDTGFVGNLDFTKRGAGALQLNVPVTYDGPTNVEAGTLRAAAANTFSFASAHTIAPGATLDLAGFDQTLSSLTNSGTVSLIGSVPGTTLTMFGPYVGNNGVIRLGTRLGDSTSPSDRLVFDGINASASGSTTLQITNLGGLGAATTGNGIEVVTARNGATTTAQSTQSAFTLANGTGIAKSAAGLQAVGNAGGHVDAGAYEYRLYAADANGAGESWYLRSSVPVVGPTNPGTGTGTGSGPGPGAGTGTGTGTGTGSGTGAGAGAGTPSIGGPLPGDPFTPVGQVTAYRAEVPLYAALASQLRQGNLAMLSNRHQRIGDDDAIGQSGSGQGASDLGDRRAWGRVLSTDLDIRQGGTVSPASQGRLSGFQVGTDLLVTREFRGGIYVGQLDGNTRVNGFASGIVGLDVGSTDLRSQYFGAYGTYTPGDGWYVDAVLQAGRHRYTVQPTLNLATGAKGSSLLASVEVGKSFDLVEGGAWKIEPSVQLAHQRLNLDDSVIAGATVQQDPHSGWIARAGVRVKGEFATGAGLLQPYARVNFYRSASGNDVTRFVGPAGSTDILSAAGSSSTELAGGFTLALNERASIYAEAGRLWSSSGDAKVKSGLQGSLGLRVRW